MEIPYTKLNPETLENFIEEFVTREGTDYGETEIPLNIKTEQVRKQLMQGTAVVIFDAEDRSCNIVERK